LLSYVNQLVTIKTVGKFSRLARYDQGRFKE